MKKHILLSFVVFGVLFAAVVSADISDWIKGITGHATSGPTNVTISVQGTSMVTIRIFNYTLVDPVTAPNESSRKPMTFVVEVSDADGWADINLSSVSANFTYGSTARANSSCPAISNQFNGSTQNFSCTISLWYFDPWGEWTVTAAANDIGNTTYNQTSNTFHYQALTSMAFSPGALTWQSVSPGQTNLTSNNDPTLINNTGNYNITNITVRGINLIGNSDPTYVLGVNNFTVDVDTGGSPAAECNGTILLNNTDVTIGGNARLFRGNYSINDGSTGQEQLYYCIPRVPTTISSQSYSTTTGGSWTIKINQ